MVNSQQITLVPLVGEGFKNKANGHYLPGEYRQALNVTLNNDGSIVNRRPIKAVLNETPTDETPRYLRNPRKFIGYCGEYAMAVEATAEFENGSVFGANISSIVRTDMNADDLELIDPGFHRTVENYVYYNGAHYFITIEGGYGGAAVIPNKPIFHTNRIAVVKSIGAADPSTIKAYASNDGNVLVDTRTSLSPPASTPVYRNPFRINNVFMFKERMWIATTTHLYFSKATDPMVWAVPDGGFFAFSDDNIKFVMPFKDGIYIFCDNSIFYLTYTTDPNSIGDVQLSRISDNVGADHATIYNDQIFFVKNDWLHTIDNSSISKVMSLDLDINVSTNDFIKLGVVRNMMFLVFQQRGFKYREGTDPIAFEETFVNPNGEVYMINMDMGFISKITYLDLITQFGSSYNPDIGASISDLLFVPVESRAMNTNFMYFMTNESVGIDTETQMISDSNGGISYLSMVEETFLDGIDTSRINPSASTNPTNNWFHFIGPEVSIEIDSYVPDGYEFFVKKFRSALMEGSFTSGFTARFAYDDGFLNMPADDDVMFSVGNEEVLRAPWPYRFGLNQKARSLTIGVHAPFTREDSPSFVGTAFPATPVNNSFQLDSLGVIWTPSGRAPLYSVK